MDCPKCGEPCDRDEVDVGVGTIYGPWGCYCGWSEADRDALREQYPGRYVDPWGGVDRIVENAEHFGLNGDVVRDAFREV